MTEEDTKSTMSPDEINYSKKRLRFMDWLNIVLIALGDISIETKTYQYTALPLRICPIPSS